MIDPRALVDVELLLMAAAHAAPANLREQEDQWRNFVAAAPEPVITYLWDVDADIVADRQAFDADTTRWMHRHHPLFDDVLQGLERACHSRVDNRLSYTQGWMLKHSWQHLQYWFAEQRRPQTGGLWIDGVVGQLAAEALLDWDVVACHRAWLEPELFVQRWREAATTDPETLARAGLHRAELALLAA